MRTFASALHRFLQPAALAASWTQDRALRPYSTELPQISSISSIMLSYALHCLLLQPRCQFGAVQVLPQAKIEEKCRCKLHISPDSKVGPLSYSPKLLSQAIRSSESLMCSKHSATNPYFPNGSLCSCWLRSSFNLNSEHWRLDSILNCLSSVSQTPHKARHSSRFLPASQVPETLWQSPSR